MNGTPSGGGQATLDPRDSMNAEDRAGFDNYLRVYRTMNQAQKRVMHGFLIRCRNGGKAIDTATLIARVLAAGNVPDRRKHAGSVVEIGGRRG